MLLVLLYLIASLERNTSWDFWEEAEVGCTFPVFCVALQWDGVKGFFFLSLQGNTFTNVNNRR